MYVLLAHLVAPKLRKVQRVRALRVCNVLARVAMSSLTTCDVVAHMNALLDHSHLTAEDDAHSVPNGTCENIYYRCACVWVYTGCSVLLYFYPYAVARKFAAPQMKTNYMRTY